MNLIVDLAERATQRQLAQSKASRESWRTLARLLGAKLRRVNGAVVRLETNIRQLDRVIQEQGRELARLRAHEAGCLTAQAIADHDLDKTASNR